MNDGIRPGHSMHDVNHDSDDHVHDKLASDALIHDVDELVVVTHKVT